MKRVLVALACTGPMILAACDVAPSSAASLLPVRQPPQQAASLPRPAMSAVSSGASGTQIASCPATSSQTPSGTRRLGEATPGLPLTSAALASTAPADYEPEQFNLNEDEADNIEGDGLHASASTFTMSAGAAPVSLVCRYGTGPEPLLARTMLLIPLQPQSAKCRFTDAASGKPATMICRPTKPVG